MWHTNCSVWKQIQPPLREAMNAFTRLLNALAFTNVGNLHDFDALLDTTDLPPVSQPDRTAAATSAHPAAASGASGMTNAHCAP